MPSPDFVDTDRDTVQRQLWDRLPGKYKLTRQPIHGKIYIKDDIIQPFHGDSEITSRASTDAAYQSELLQTSSIRIETTSGKAATTYERRVFRLLQGKLLHGERSVWNANAGNGVVKGNLTDVELGNEVQEPKGHGQNRWQDGEFGPRKPPLMDVVVYLYFYLSDAPYWEMSQFDGHEPRAHDAGGLGSLLPETWGAIWWHRGSNS